MASTRLEDLTPDTLDVARRFIERAGADGIGVKIISTLRTCSDQAKIYAQGRTEPGAIISGASGCRSWHVWGRAFDVMAVGESGSIQDGRDPRYDRLGDIGRDLGLVWGGNFTTRHAEHFEYHPGLSIDDICPDRGEDISTCQRQIDYYNANAAYPPGIVSVRIVNAESDFDVPKILASAFVGALGFYLASHLIKSVGKSQK